MGDRVLRDEPAQDFVWGFDLARWHREEFADIERDASAAVKAVLQRYREPTFGVPTNLAGWPAPRSERSS